MKLSVIIPCYNFCDYIEECINSVLNQIVNFEYEIIIRDDGSKDNTEHIVKEKFSHLKNLRLLDSSINYGVSHNPLILNKECVGEYVFYIDGDDYLLDRDYLQRAVDFLDNNKNYVVYSSGCKYKENDTIYPETQWVCSALNIVTLKDLLITNYICFGRVYRKLQIESFDKFINFPYPDWIFNFELLKNGDGYCDNSRWVGIYRFRDGSVFSKKTPEEKYLNNEIIKRELERRYVKHTSKILTIIDSFVHNESIKNKLKNTLAWMREDEHEVLLISNTQIDKNIIENVNYYIYDSNNRLFTNTYTNLPYLDSWKLIGDMYLHDISFSLQKHGLSVLVNLFNVLTYAKSLGYTHFQRFEVDDLYGPESRKYIKNVPVECFLQNKRGLFYYNDSNFPPDISFHYFYCDIDYFLSKIHKITCESDYKKYLLEFYKNQDFKIVEVFIYDCLKKNLDDEILKKSGGQQMLIDFNDTVWNTETSISNYHSKYKGCTTKLYKYNDDYILLTHNYTNQEIQRSIRVEYSDNSSTNIIHTVLCINAWNFNHLPKNIKNISVYQDETLMYTEDVNDVHSYITRKN
jgi:glycosyltransferase involved in cell wall biosynthesis